MGFAARAGAFSALAVNTIQGCVATSMQAGAVGLSLQSHASQLPKPCWQESVGGRDLRAAPQPAVQWFLRGKKEETAGHCWVPAAPAAALGLGTQPCQS